MADMRPTNNAPFWRKGKWIATKCQNGHDDNQTAHDSNSEAEGCQIQEKISMYNWGDVYPTHDKTLLQELTCQNYGNE